MQRPVAADAELGCAMTPQTPDATGRTLSARVRYLIRDRPTAADTFVAVNVVAGTLIAALDRVQALETAQSWKPIETAPHDGAVLLLWAAGWPLPETGIHLDVGPSRILGGTQPAGWYPYSGTHRWNRQPTHWMPLPAPPTGGSR